MGRLSEINVLLFGGSTHATPGERVVPPESRILSIRCKETALAKSHLLVLYTDTV